MDTEKVNAGRKPVIMSPRMKFPLRLVLLTCLAATVASQPAMATLHLPEFFSDHAVLQRDRPVPVWGWADKDEAVTVHLGGQTRTTTADGQGRWSVRFDPLPATAPDAAPLTLEVSDEGNELIACRDVLVGEVWLCSGQSNMEFTMTGVLDGAKEIAAANDPRIRQFQVPRDGASTPQNAAFLNPARWEPATTPGSVAHFTAVGYYFAREISRALGGVPVGIIDSTWGGTAIQSWMSVEALQAAPGRYEALLKGKEKETADWPARQRQIEADTRDWEKRAAEAKAAGQPAPPNKPWNPGPPDQPQWTPANLYNGMIHPLLPYAIRGALWYQGEANAGFGKAGAAEYTALQADLIRSWRAAWNEGDFPFDFVQLPNWREGGKADGTNWAYFRDAQRAVLDAVPNTGMAVTIDMGESEDIHPRNKQVVGHRLALLALKNTYGQSVADRGPVFRAAHPDGAGGMRVEFDGAGDGLVAKDGPPRNFELAGADKIFHPADAAVQGDAVIVSCALVAAPVAVRYAWSNDPAGCNLYNHDGLPAAPFRTDDW